MWPKQSQARNLGSSGSGGGLGGSGPSSSAGGGAPAFVVTKSFSWPTNSNTIFVRAVAANNGQNFTNTHTLNVWVKGANLPQAVVCMKGDGFQGCASDGYFANVGAKFGINMGGTAVNSTASAFDSTWHMATIVCSAGNVTCYVDGVASGTGTLASGPTACPTKEFQIGAYTNPGNVTDGFVGSLCHLSQWDIALSGAEVAALASAGKPANLANHTQVAHLKSWYYLGDGDATGAGNVKDYSGNAFHATINGAITIATDAP